jgi:hypothetical protein
MPGSFGKTMARGAGALALCALLAAGAALGPALSSEAAAARLAPVGSRSAWQNHVMQALGIRNVRAGIVILVDISLSMGPGFNDLYPTVRRKVLDYLGVLAKQDPQDRVGVILFGKPSDSHVTDPGPPSRHIWLPKAPYSDDTDFGWAFQQAVHMLVDTPGIKAGAVLLLSDGELSVPASVDPKYGPGFTAPGWNELRTQVQNLQTQIPITGYDVPLTDNTTFTGNQYHALRHVFQNVQSLPQGTTNLGEALSLATQGLLDSEVAKAAAHDIGRGVRVTWSGLPGAGGPAPNLGSGQSEVTVTVTATTRRVPVHLSGLSVTSTGLPVIMRGTLPGSYTLAPGQSATWPVRLRWRPETGGPTMSGNPQTLRGRLLVDGTVSSPFTRTLRSAFGDTAFSVGGILQALGPRFPVAEPAAYSLLLLVVLPLLALVALLTGGGVGRAWLAGTLTVEALDGDPQPVGLSRLHVSTPTDELIGKPGRMTVNGVPIRRGFPIRRGITVRMRIDGRPRFKEQLRSGESAMPAGIEITYERKASPAAPAESGGTAPGSKVPASKVAADSDDEGEKGEKTE